MSVLEHRSSSDLVVNPAEPQTETKEERRARRKALAKKYTYKGATFLGKATWKLTKGLYHYLLLVAALNQAAQEQQE